MHHANRPTRIQREDRIVAEVEAARDEIVAFTAEMIRIPTVNPPGACYRDCAELVGRRLQAAGMVVEYVEAEGRPEHTAEHPRVNVVGRGPAVPGRPRLHLNGHFDVVPPGEGWTVDPFAGLVRDGRIYGRGASDMKSGISAAVFAVEALRRAGVELAGAVDISATVDEESGGFAGVAHLCETGNHLKRPHPIRDHPGAVRAHSGVPGAPGRLLVRCRRARPHGPRQHEPSGAQRHRGHGRPPGSPSEPGLSPSSPPAFPTLPIVPELSRRPSLNVNAITGGQAGEPTQSPCVADRCVATVDRRFIPEEPFEEVRAEIARLVGSVEDADPGRRFTIEERMVVHPTSAPPGRRSWPPCPGRWKR